MLLVYLTDRKAVLAAMKDFDRRKRDGFLKHHGYGRALNYFIRHDGTDYDSKAIAGVAAGLQMKRPPLKASEFTGGQATVVRKMRGLGFEVIDRREPSSGRPKPKKAAASSSATWRLIDDQATSNRAFKEWRAALSDGAEARGSRSLWRADLQLRMTFQDDGRTQLATEDVGGDWAVELNAPTSAGNANRTTAVARDPSGDLWLLRQARLKLKGRHQGYIFSDEFLEVSGLGPVPVQVVSGPGDRVWVRVCQLDLPPADVAAETARFVSYCRLVRDQRGPSKLPAKALAFARGVLAGPEVMGYLKAKAKPAVPPQEIWKAQAEVWQALDRCLRAVGRELEKPRPAPGFEVDGLVRGGREPVLIEVKTASGAADVYTGLGQLQLYHRMLELPARCKRVLLLPAAPSPHLRQALKDLGVIVSIYTKGAGPVAERISFEPSLLNMCGL